MIRINGRRVGPGHATYVVAELSANHHQRWREAVALVKAAKSAGADAVKLQTYTPDTMTLAHDGKHFRIAKGSPWAGRTLHDLYREAYTPWNWHPRLQRLARRLGLELFSTPFDASAVDFLQRLRVPAYKIASFEIVDLPLIRRVARTGKPLILSTGMATHSEISEAVRAARKAGNRQIALLKCTSAYPAPPEEMNLRTIPDLARTFKVPVGLSDHTLGSAAPVAAVALGACILEKHLTLSRKSGGPDAAFSLEPREFRAMVDAVRSAEKALGHAAYGPTPHEAPNRIFRRSIFVVRDIRAGESLTEENIRCIRPGHGLPPRDWDRVLGRRAARDIAKGTPLRWSLIRGRRGRPAKRNL